MANDLVLNQKISSSLSDLQNNGKKGWAYKLFTKDNPELTVGEAIMMARLMLASDTDCMDIDTEDESKWTAACTGLKMDPDTGEPLTLDEAVERVTEMMNDPEAFGEFQRVARLQGVKIQLDTLEGRQAIRVTWLKGGE
jgi:hypothetical protein